MSLHLVGQFLQYSFLALCMIQVQASGRDAATAHAHASGTRAAQIMSAVLIDPRHIRFFYTFCSMMFGLVGFVIMGLGVRIIVFGSDDLWLER